MSQRAIISISLTVLFSVAFSQDASNTRVNGYRGIWFELNQKYKYGDKYSGALSTYTAKHIPLAQYSPKVDKTFFVFGGTPSERQRHLFCMIGEYDHSTGLVSRPTRAVMPMSSVNQNFTLGILKVKYGNFLTK